jgi:acyl-coenzyme A synthetase/AMP-(fatty) acid ligase
VIRRSTLLTYGELHDQARALAEVLAKHDMGPGHRVLVQLDPLPAARMSAAPAAQLPGMIRVDAHQCPLALPQVEMPVPDQP